MNTVKIIGLGGIGSNLYIPLGRLLQFSGSACQVIMYDGDSFEPKNGNRQYFNKLQNKATESAEEMKKLFPDLEVEAKQWYVTQDNIFLSIREKDVVFLCVDNHPTRKLVSDHCGTLDNVILISGGNDYTDGNIQLYVRRDGTDFTPALDCMHPEIANPKGKNPAEMSCEELAAAGVPQLFVVNCKVAVEMLNTFWLAAFEEKITYSEMYFDIETGMTRSVLRKKE